MSDITVLSIESSCDETAAAVVVNGRDVRSNVISTQIPIHTLYGGVVPEIASRNHVARINRVIKEALSDAKCTLDDIDVIGVTYGPGLVGPLLVGVSEAKAISFAKNIPLVGVNHIKGHIHANYIAHPDLEPPFFCLIISGGHTNFIRVTSYTEYEIIGRTRDDAAGEAFDKVARSIGLGYPGGPKIEQAAKLGNDSAITFPIAHIDEAPMDFSFSGLKSAVLNYQNSAKQKGEHIEPNDIAACFQRAVIDAFLEKVELASDTYHLDKLAVCGGVAANQTLIGALNDKCESLGIKLYNPPLVLCTDNAAMIGCAAYYEYLDGNLSDMSLNAIPNLSI